MISGIGFVSEVDDEEGLSYFYFIEHNDAEYSVRGLNPRPSPCEGDVITATPTKLKIYCSNNVTK